VKNESDGVAPPSPLESLGLKEVSTRAISGHLAEPTTIESQNLDTLLTSTTSLIQSEEPLIDESEPIKYLGPHSISIVDSSQPHSQLEDEMADLSLVEGDNSLGAKPFSAKEQELMRDLPRRECNVVGSWLPFCQGGPPLRFTVLDFLFKYPCS